MVITRKPVVTPCNRERTPWMVTFYVGGKRRREFRKSETDAHERANVLAQSMMQQEEIPASLFKIREYQKADLFLAHYGMEGQIMAVCREWAETHRPRDTGSEAKRITVYGVIEQIRKMKARAVKDEAIRKRSYWSNDIFLRHIERTFGPGPITTLTPSVIEDWLLNLQVKKGGVVMPAAPSTVDHYWSAMKHVIKFSLMKGYLTRFDYTEVKISKAKLNQDIRDFYSIGEVKKILAGLIKYPDFDLTGMFILQLFCGLRSEEVWDPHYDKPPLLWLHVDFDERSISLPSGIDKKGYRRFLQNMPEVAWDWLEIAATQKVSATRWRSNKDRIYNDGRKTGSVAPKGCRRRIRTFFDTIGVEFRSNGLRRTLATYYANATQDSHKAAELLRHQGTTMLLQHYLGLENPQGYIATKAKGEEFLRLRPSGLPSRPS